MSTTGTVRHRADVWVAHLTRLDDDSPFNLYCGHRREANTIQFGVQPRPPPGPQSSLYFARYYIHLTPVSHSLNFASCLFYPIGHLGGNRSCPYNENPAQTTVVPRHTENPTNEESSIYGRPPMVGSKGKLDTGTGRVARALSGGGHGGRSA